jgi:hypothetical protein
MVEPISLFGGLAAGIQLVCTAAHALLVTIKLVKTFKDLPIKLSLLLSDVENSINRLCHSCNLGSTIISTMDITQIERLTQSTIVLHSALQDIHRKLVNLTHDEYAREIPGRRLWQTFMSLTAEKELAEKLERLNRLNVEMLKELSLLGLEMQIATNSLVKATGSAANEKLTSIESKMTALYDDFQVLTMAVQQARGVIMPSSEHYGKSFASTSDSTLGLQAPSQQYQVNGHRSVIERETKIRLYLENIPGIRKASIPQQLSTCRLPAAQLDFLLYNIRAFYTRGNFDEGPTGKTSVFWGNTYHAIEMTKVSAGKNRGSSKSQLRGSQLLDNLISPDLGNPLMRNTRTVLIELFSTLSPLNTAHCSYIRDSLLGHLKEFASEDFPYNHPIKVVIEMLKDSTSEAYISLRALKFIVDTLRSVIGSAHDLTILAVDKLCTLLRQTGDYDEALRVGYEGVGAVRFAFGSGSLQERWLLRRIEHIYIDQCNWTFALSVCFDIIGQQEEDGLAPGELIKEDACAIFTMEDVAKICECVGNTEQSLAWLKKAKSSGDKIWGELEVLAHIDDKVQEVSEELECQDDQGGLSKL